ncbi:GNAT family N-acetyltransferase [Flavobacterium aquariorum]|uniref:GNAT family N-acetyltransferase n=1 Tax=Flavobacterium aquariorum TaxID=2217670 RepID=A0A2W7TXS2_9FLAO|nr:GNAT family N-acetyltransferase [Flavobacterium aquariorum]PZX95111.1 GNAT family N-acetyltransferase [Flavobacterium aquariorum]
MATSNHKLDNPVWYSVSETHKDFGIDFGTIKFYHPDYCPFGGFIDFDNIEQSISEYAKLASNFFIIGQKPNVPDSLKLNNELICLQMTIHDKIEGDIEDQIVKLEEEHLDDLLGLVKIVYPDYFKKKTSSLGNYYGIYKNNQLVAVTGERMQMDEYIEISAVITHPEHTGKGYAKQLVAHTANAIFAKNKTPFLHVAESNIGAIKLYKKLGFQTRTKISVWNIIQKLQ